MRRPLRRLGGRTLAAVATATAIAGTLAYRAYELRPRYLESEEDERMATFRRTGAFSTRAEEAAPLTRLMRAATLTLVTAAMRTHLEILNDFKVRKDERYELFMRLVRGGKPARGNRGLLTVANHTSVLDDPMLQSTLVGFAPALEPQLHRWGICKAQICFKDALHASFTGAGKVIPAVVGAGLEQPLFKSAARKLADGDWVHIFPEGGCNQTGRVGQGHLRVRLEGFVLPRDEATAERIGRLKWGVGKLAARVAFGPNREPPLIIPYYHVGMSDIMPQVNLPHDNSLATRFPRVGQRVRVIVGRPIDISDLIADFEAKHGPRRVVSVSPHEDEGMTGWDGSAPHELQLYSAIARRVENALVELEREHADKPVS